MEETLCPYPGLRPYTEEESVYFKGRDEQIVEISKLIETRKFLMVTGASGDGKSSLIYAGVMPYARAGLLKAKFNNWTLADFRPERSPLRNLAISVSIALDLDEERCFKELSLGFSALIDLYKESKHYEDFKDSKWEQEEDDSKKKRKRSCANLLILVDQFEEFFTNSENYYKGNPSDEAQNVVNLLLETAVLAQEQDIPIYIICTMRSDFIGQCASFRNLPEFIGHSHFFVPRLKRQEIRQVIEEPAVLSGMKISSGLIEELINSISEGFDQLPLMQHTLHQVWRLAAVENEMMDFKHLAMVGGIMPELLSAEDKKTYLIWLESQEAYKKEYLKKKGLGNVLNLHANELFESIIELGNTEVDDEYSKLILKKTFQCLTKMDDGRGVRNRMTVNEVLNIINREDLTIEKFNIIINPFRTEGNTFVSPFIFTENDVKLEGETMLDITHESLLRNWDKLIDWSVEEDKSFQTYADFKKQLLRWRENKKSRAYLLPIGPLTHFEVWFKSSTYNKFWIKKYETEAYVEVEALSLLKDSKKYLFKSRMKNLFGLLLLKYGFEKVITGFLSIILLLSSFYFLYDYSVKTNENVITNINERSEEIYSSSYVKDASKSDYIILREIDQPGKGIELIKALEDTLSIQISFSILQKLNVNLKKEDTVFIKELYFLLKENIKENQKLVYLINLIHLDENLLIKEVGFVSVEDREQHVKDLYTEVFEQIEKDEVENYHDFLNAIKFLSWNREQLGDDYTKLVESVSPFEAGKLFFESNFIKEEFIKTSTWQNSPKMSHNGGYYVLTLLYAGHNRVFYYQSLDSLEKFSPNQVFSGYGSVSWYNSAVIATLFDDVPTKLIEKVANKFNSDPKKYFLYLSNVIQGNSSNWGNNIPLYSDQKGFWKSSNVFSFGHRFSKVNILEVHKKMEKQLSLYQFTSDETYFYKAIFNKRTGVALSKLNTDNTTKSYFDKSLEYYQSISNDYLSRKYDGPTHKLVGDLKTPRVIYFSPSSFSPLHAGNSYQTVNLFSSKNKEGVSFVNFILQLDSINIDSASFEKILNGVLYREMGIFGHSDPYLVDTSQTTIILNQLSLLASLSNVNIDTNAINAYLFLIGKKNWESIDTSVFLKTEYINGTAINESSTKLGLLMHIVKLKSLDEDVSKYLKLIPDEDYKFKTQMITLNYLVENKKWNKAFDYLKIALNKLAKEDKFPFYLLKIMGEIGGDQFTRLSLNLIKNIPDEKKVFGIKFYIEGLLKNRSYYHAIQLISDQASYETEVLLMNEILKRRLIKKIDEIDEIWYRYLKFRDWRDSELMFDLGGNVFIYF